MAVIKVQFDSQGILSDMDINTNRTCMYIDVASCTNLDGTLRSYDICRLILTQGTD